MNQINKVMTKFTLSLDVPQSAPAGDPSTSQVHVVKSHRKKTVHPSVAFIAGGSSFVIYTWVISVYSTIPTFNSRPWNIIFIVALLSPYFTICFLIPLLIFIVNGEFRHFIWRELLEILNNWTVVESVDNWWRRKRMILPMS